MIRLRQTVIVEGRYDKAKLSSILDATILTTDGFSIFHDREKLNLMRTLAARDGLVILTDSDAAGFRIRAFIAQAVDAARVTHVYIPDLLGKERRKAHASAEGKLGVEGVPAEVLRAALARAGIGTDDTPAAPRNPVTQADLLLWGLAGGADSAQRRRAALGRLGLPARLSTKAMLAVLNSLYTRERLETLLREESHANQP